MGISSLLSQVFLPRSGSLSVSPVLSRCLGARCQVLRAPAPHQGTDLGHAFTPPPPAPCQQLHLRACSCHSSSCCLQLITHGASRGAESGWVWLGPGMGTGPSQPTRAQHRSLTRPVGSRVKPKGVPSHSEFLFYSFLYPAAAGLPSENLPKCLSCFLFCFAQVMVEGLCTFKYKERPNLSEICF